MDDVIFHIAPRSAWEQARSAGVYSPPSLATEGFIHFSRAEQVAAVANRVFRQVEDLVLLHVLTERVSAPLRDEDSHGDGERFPHLYGPLNLDAVTAVVPFPEGADGFAPPANPAD